MRDKTRRPGWLGVASAAAVFTLAAGAAVAAAQHAGHSAPAQPKPAPVGLGDCGSRVEESLRAVDVASRRIEEARQTNNPAKMRAAVEQLQRDLDEIRVRLSPKPPVTGATTPRGDKVTPIP